MAKKIQHSVRWEAWIASAIDAWAEKNGKKTFSESVNYLLALELERWGYERANYEPGITETPPKGFEYISKLPLDVNLRDECIKLINKYTMTREETYYFLEKINNGEIIISLEKTAEMVKTHFSNQRNSITKKDDDKKKASGT